MQPTFDHVVHVSMQQQRHLVSALLQLLQHQLEVGVTMVTSLRQPVTPTDAVGAAA
jgi:hypothetical protein